MCVGVMLLLFLSLVLLLLFLEIQTLYVKAKDFFFNQLIKYDVRN